MQHFIAPCSYACPVHTDVPRYIDEIINGNYIEAYQTIKDKNPFPGVCGWICPHPCEDNCRRAQIDESLNIRALKRFAVEQARNQYKNNYSDDHYHDNHCEVKNLPGGDVVVIGAGPSGLTAAFDLNKQGFSVTVLERNEKPGGHFYTSIPQYRLPREVLNSDIFAIKQSGVDIYCRVEVGKDITLNELQNKYRSVILAVGLQAGKLLPIPNINHPSVLTALTYLKGANLGNSVPVGKKVAVIGGGNVAMDVARTALRLGVEKVVVVCIESPEEMPAHSWEVEETLEEGIKIFNNWGPSEIVIDEENKIRGLKLKKVLLAFDENGNFKPQFNNEITSCIAADSIILAIGQEASLDFAKNFLDLDERGNLVADRDTMNTSMDGFFACGEVIEGAGMGISAVASGHRVADKVAAYLNKKLEVNNENPVLIGRINHKVAHQIPPRKRNNLYKIKPEKRINNLNPFEIGYSVNQSVSEAGRCLRCSMGAKVDISKCVACLTCQRVCPFGVPAVESRAKISPDDCQSCGICASACPASAITINSIQYDSDNIDQFQKKNYLIKIYACRKVMNNIEFDSLPATTYLRVLPCAGSLNKNWVLKDFELGYRGVAVLLCNDDCNTEGLPKYTGFDFNLAVNLCETVGVDRTRLCQIKYDDNLMERINQFNQMINDLQL